MEQVRIEHVPNGSVLTYITSADALVNKCDYLRAPTPLIDPSPPCLVFNSSNISLKLKYIYNWNPSEKQDLIKFEYLILIDSFYHMLKFIAINPYKYWT